MVGIKKAVIGIITLTFVIVNVAMNKQLHEKGVGGSSEGLSGLMYLPVPVLDLMSLEYKGILTDLLMMSLTQYHGKKLMEKETLSPEEWERTVLALQTITDLDPRFWDPYVFAETTLPWESGMVDEVNSLLKKAAKARNDDYRPYFFLWFNYIHFLKDPVQAQKYIELSARKPTAPMYFATLAARESYMLNDTQAAIVFLKSMLLETYDDRRRQWISTRLEVLQSINMLQSKIEEFENAFGYRPEKLNDLVTFGFVNDLPVDPYGGQFYIDKSGRVYTTSKMAYIKKGSDNEN